MMSFLKKNAATITRLIGVNLLIITLSFFTFQGCSGSDAEDEETEQPSQTQPGGGNQNDSPNSGSPVEETPAEEELTSFPPGERFQWQLQNAVDETVNADVYDIDLEENESNGVIASLKSQGRKVICYFSAGTYENWRSDEADFPAEVLGNDNGWAGEKWLDIRHATVRTIMAARIQRAIDAGCDAVEPDNVDGYLNGSGFPLTESDQLNYLNFLADTAHDLGIAIGLKNAVDLISTGSLHEVFDFAINEECYTYSECDTLIPFITNGKAVFIAEYNDTHTNKCTDANSKQFELVIFDMELDGSKRVSCN